MSGTGNSQEPDFVEPDPDMIFALFERIGFVPPPGRDDGERPGLDFASRAEIKLATVRPGEPLGVSGPICEDTKRFFQRLADHIDDLQVITDPTGTYVFERGQPVDHIPFPEDPEGRGSKSPAKSKPHWWQFW